MKNNLSVLLVFFFAFSDCFADNEIARKTFDEALDGNLQSVPNEALKPPTSFCSSSAGYSKFLDELVSTSFKNDKTCRTVFTGNAGDTAEGDQTYAKTMAYAMAEEMCGNTELHQNFLNKRTDKHDALSLERFNDKSKNSNNVSATYSLIYALGYRESSGNFLQPRDVSVKLSGSQEEVGFTQTSANSLNDPGNGMKVHVLLESIFRHYVSSLSDMKSKGQMAKFCLNDKLRGNKQTKLYENDSTKGKRIAFDHEGNGLFELFNNESSNCKKLSKKLKGTITAKDDSSDPVVKCFKDLHKNCPGFSIKFGAAVARSNRTHHGPLRTNQEKQSPKPSCQLLFNSIVKDKEKICAEMGIKAGPDVEIKDEKAGEGLELASASPTISPSSPPSPVGFSQKSGLIVGPATDYGTGTSSSLGGNSSQVPNTITSSSYPSSVQNSFNSGSSPSPEGIGQSASLRVGPPPDNNTGTNLSSSTSSSSTLGVISGQIPSNITSSSSHPSSAQNDEEIASSPVSNSENSSSNPTISMVSNNENLYVSDSDTELRPNQNGVNPNDTFRAPYIYNSYSDFSENRVPRSTLSVAQGLNEDAFRSFIGGLKARSSGLCAKHVRMALNKLFGRGPDGGPSAKNYNERVLSQWQTKDAQYKKVEDNGSFQDFDIRVLQPSRRGNPHGHIEIYYKGQWYSDFKQGGSLWDYNSGNYIEASTYRLTPKTSAMNFFEKLEMIASLILPKAFAEDGSNENTTLNQKQREVILAKVRDKEGVDWILVNQEVGDFSFPTLYKLSKGKKVKVDQDNKSPYLLLNRLEDKKLAHAIASNLVEQWIKDEGRENVEKVIGSRRNFFELEVEALKKLGIKTPKEYKILIN